MKSDILPILAIVAASVCLSVVGLSAQSDLPTPAQAASLTVDTQDRQAVIRFYKTFYKASQALEPGWSGDVSTCLAGDTAQSFKDGTALRVNYFRAMAGLPGSVVFTADLNRKCQQAALMMSAADAVSHTPGTDWPCYSAEGADAASHCNLSLGAAGPDAVDAYVDDPGEWNTAVGHRRWILYPPLQQMGGGAIPTVWSPTGEILTQGADALWVHGAGTTRPDGPAFIAWPPPGYVPQPVMPNGSGRWSFSYPAANLAKARVLMSCAGTNVAVSLEPIQNGYGDNTLVWKPTLAGGAQIGATYTVSVSNVLVAGQSRIFNYAVSVIDPDEVNLTGVRLPDGRLQLSWSATNPQSTLQGSGSIASEANWQAVSAAVQLTNDTYYVTLPMQPPGHFYRLKLSSGFHASDF